MRIPKSAILNIFTSLDKIWPLDDCMDRGLSHPLGFPEVRDPVIRDRNVDKDVLTLVMARIPLAGAGWKTQMRAKQNIT